ncbi:MAG: hypothetical protein IPK50_19505 [Fibrobacterota bacterium]|nr:MAG: hypothetical protein IPK50_19505 [Fibrobacterota bacterium]
MLVRMEKLESTAVSEILNQGGLGIEAKAKTLTKLRALVLQPQEDLAQFASQGLELAQQDLDACAPIYSWGMSLVTYPFFAKVVEITGRLTALHGECSAHEVHRRLSEIYGARGVCTNGRRAVFQSLVDWGILDRSELITRIVRKPALAVPSPMTAWLVESALRQINRGVPASYVPLLPTLFPFDLEEDLSYVLSRSPNATVSQQGGQVVISHINTEL